MKWSFGRLAIAAQRSGKVVLAFMLELGARFAKKTAAAPSRTIAAAVPAPAASQGSAR